MKYANIVCACSNSETVHIIKILPNELVEAVCRVCKTRSKMAPSDTFLKELQANKDL